MTPAPILGVLSCPLCHTPGPGVSQEALDARPGWQCHRCGQRWDAESLAAFEAYTAWSLEHDHPSGPALMPGA